MPDCSACKKNIARPKFTKNQLRKGPSVRKCKACVAEKIKSRDASISRAKNEESSLENSGDDIVTKQLIPETGSDEYLHVSTTGESVDDSSEADKIRNKEGKKEVAMVISSAGMNDIDTEKKEAKEEDDFAKKYSNCTEPENTEKREEEIKDEETVDDATEGKDINNSNEQTVDDLQKSKVEKELSVETKEVLIIEKDSAAKKEELNANRKDEESLDNRMPFVEEIRKEEATIDRDTIATSSIADEAKSFGSAATAKEVTTIPESVPRTPTPITSTIDIIEVKTESQVEQMIHPNKIHVGICAMDKKARSKPMGEILSRLDKSLFELVYFGDPMILDVPVEEWPECDVLIAFFSNGYPLEKVEKYVDLVNPFLVNDLKMQHILKDRRRVYDALEAAGIDVPRHVFMNRDGYQSFSDDASAIARNLDGVHDSCEIDDGCEIDDDSEDEHEETEFVEYDDHIEVNGVTIHKPFVEKPVDADDHNIAIYYPSSAGGGCKKLFRKIGDRSSEFYSDINEIRRDGSYIYEEFVETQGTDVKMYTVGPDYGHAEARKSPAVDGKVERNEDGKEVRFPVILTLREKEIARRIVLVFKQYVCGFDLLRVQEGDSLVSYVCDCNGFSFVKKSRKYYDDCAQILTEHMLAAIKPKALHGFSALDPLMANIKDSVVNTPRRRRQKTFPRDLNLDEMEFNFDEQEVKKNSGIAEPATLVDGAKPVREMPDRLINNPASRCTSAASSINDDDTAHTNNTAEKRTASTHQEELRCVTTIVRHGDRTPKQKLKVNISEHLLMDYFHKYSTNCKKDLKIKDKKPMTEFLATVKAMIAEKQETSTAQNQTSKSTDVLNKLLHMRDVLERWKIGGLNRKLQLKPRKWDEFVDDNGKKILRCAELQLILKWGGNLTKLGEKQAIILGKKLRNKMYPNTPGGGILRLHSTFRHDMKIKTSDEGRVMKTAAAFAKGLLELEGPIPPILVSLVHRDKHSLHMLDPSGNKEVKVELEECKLNINEQFQQDFEVNEASQEKLTSLVGPDKLESLHKALHSVGNPRKSLFKIRDVIAELLDQLDDMLGGLASDMENKHEGGEGLKGDDDDDEALCGIKLYKGETLLELTERWRLLHKKLYDEDKDEFDLSRVPDVHDNVRFDMLHNPHLGLTSTLGKLYNLAKVLADCVVPQEYGTTIEEKRSIGNKMCRALLEKIKYDLIIARTDNQVDMRYMINLDYSADLPINTMGRRIRTRLYFTSESHLHTLLNVLRFPSEGSHLKSPLSKRGQSIISSSPELCYLTQVVIRLFENTSKDVQDPKRFRIEILFSPGATATPLHMSELKRDDDSSRFDTEPLQLISSDYLACQEVEDYFSESIREGEVIENDDDGSIIDDASMKQTMIISKKTKQPKIVTKKPSEITIACPLTSTEPQAKKEISKSLSRSVTIAEDKNTEFEPPAVEVVLLANKSISTRNMLSVEEENDEDVEDEDIEDVNVEVENVEDEDEANGNSVVERGKLDAMARVLSKQFFWTAIAGCSFALGVGFLVLSREVVQSDFKTRKWSRR
mmetsp:Transcript_22354/g.34107  ORF Transcript_22354/g.34107 Transcript_22354/m.34107 type:complete len:1540 (-) Transcript_22354:14-4633(-)